jgi:hypothetical protein
MRKPSVDLIAFILALTLGLSVILIIAAVIIQIFVASNNPVLSAAPSQVIDSAVTGIIGVLGSYVGYSMKRKHDDDATGDNDREDRET